MLWGMALEALLKAVVIEKSKEIQFTHNLIELSVDAGIEFSDDQKKLLKVLSEAIIWHGRYPVPKKEVHWDNYIELSRDVLFDKVPFSPGSSLKVYTPNDCLSWESVDELWNPILLELASIAKWITTN
jgi:hypothetical protein